MVNAKALMQQQIADVIREYAESPAGEPRVFYHANTLAARIMDAFNFAESEEGAAAPEGEPLNPDWLT